MVIGIVIAAIILLGVIIVAANYNGLVKKNATVEEAFSTMDVYLKKRFDLIPNLVETVKGYVKHEDETLSKIVKLREKGYGGSNEEKIKLSQQMNNQMPNIFALGENYPELKASENFNQLMVQLQQIENDIANSRKYYNGTVKVYNIAVQAFPSCIFAKIFGYTKKESFIVEDTTQRENVKVTF